MSKLVLLSGCSGGGKSTLLAELAKRGFAVTEEPGRRIVKQQLESAGDALPWVNMAGFAQRAIGMAVQDLQNAQKQSRLTFFDRGLIDAVAALHHATGEAISNDLVAQNRYHDEVFMTPPWPEIYHADAERRLKIEDAIAEYERLRQVFPALGYRVRVLPKLAVEQRADFVLRHLPRELFL
ncbi:putative ATPase [Rhizobium sp. BK529]|uniref:AAA family ATPase n=1 Tax=unclassified Rhizobium TaxID=2613769 RepID=UPI00104342E3|nr:MULTISPECIES: AAA family ATPase [unclassified Rhizobium]MBB3595011.1 putative ATPase [Rhizobium sp. BK529]TCR98729.1 putative ATPase [Rhizobium sp. BK418]